MTPTSGYVEADASGTFAGAPALAAARPAATDRQQAAARALTIFSFLWAFAALFHQAAYPSRAFGFSALLVTLPSLVLLASPGSLPRLTAVAALQVVHVMRLGPGNVSNHWIFTFFVNVTILLTVATLLVRGRGRGVGRGDFFLHFAPTARVLLLVLYTFAVVHKLNADWFTPALSCATDHYASIAARLPFLPRGSWVDAGVIYGTLLVEAAIPFLLVATRTRLFGVLLAVVFHFGLVLNPSHVFFDFSSMLFALYFLFLPYDYWNALRVQPLRMKAGQWVRSRLDGGALRRGARWVAYGMAVLLIGAYLFRLAPETRAQVWAMRESVRALFVVYGMALIATFLVVARARDVVGGSRALVSFRPLTVWGVVMPAVVFFNGMNPYLGLKTESSFAMFSNLRTEGGVTNHLFIPSSLQVATYQDTLVRVIDSSDPALARFGRQPRLLTMFEFRRKTARVPEAGVTYAVGERVHAVPRIGAVPLLATPPSTLERLFLNFRTVAAPGTAMGCRH